MNYENRMAATEASEQKKNIAEAIHGPIRCILTSLM